MVNSNNVLYAILLIAVITLGSMCISNAITLREMTSTYNNEIHLIVDKTIELQKRNLGSMKRASDSMNSTLQTLESVEIQKTNADTDGIKKRKSILEALWVVESGRRMTPPDGDGGRAIGPLQIHRVYWLDAVAADKELGGCYDDCRELTYARRVVRAYMKRYVPRAWMTADAEIIARTHNGGPRGANKSATDGYWVKVQKILKKM